MLLGFDILRLCRGSYELYKPQFSLALGLNPKIMGWDVVYAIRVLAILIYLFKILNAGNKLLLDKNIHYV